MTDKREKLLKRLGELLEKYFLPLMLGAVVMNIIFITYMKFNSNTATFLYVIYECLLFAFFEWLKPKKIIRGLIYLAAAAALLFLSRQLISSGWYATGITFIDWFYVNSMEVGEVDQYLYFIFVGLGFFITSILYYFTVYRYRVFGTMLIVLFPFVIYGKRDEDIDVFKLTVMMTVFLALMVHQRLVSDEARKNTVINFSYAAAAAVFVTFVGAATMVIPKPEYESKLEKDSSIFDMNVNSNTTEYDNLNDVSSPRFGADATGEVLFRMKTSADEEVVYLRRQSFDVFENDRWELSGEYTEYKFDEESSDNEVNSSYAVYYLMKSLAETGRYDSYGLTANLYGGEAYSTTSWVNLSSSTYSPTYIPAPLMIHADPMTYAYRTPHGEVFYDGISKQYSGLGASYGYTVEGNAEYEFAENFPLAWDSFAELLYEAYCNGDITPNQYVNFASIYSRYTDVYGYSPEMEQLAHEIADGYENEFDKAQAFVDYFEDNGYIYDLEYEPEDESIDYFLFESKTGSCTSYATSMTLMARIVGLPARYVEGFAAYEKDEDGTFIVRDSHAHAFVEVYIAGVGWVTFDPTVPGYMQDFSGADGNAGEMFRTFMNYFSRIALFIGVIFVLVFIVLLDRIAELFFRISMLFRKTNSTKTIALYRHIVRLLEISSRQRIKGYTPHELCDFAHSQRGADVLKTAELFEQTCFGGYSPSDGEFAAAYADYKLAWKALAGKLKEKKSKHRKKA